MVLLLQLLLLVAGYTVILLKRSILDGRSTCSDVVTYDKHSCWLPAKFNRTIWLIVDALRYDFVDPSSKDGATNPFHHHQMPFIAQLLSSSPQQAKLFRFMADSPTATFQRIKALATGTIPAFIEVSDNFGGAVVNEDNLIEQHVNNARNVTFLGDDTWLELFPNHFNRHFEAPSFDIKDLDTVDNAVIEKIYLELERKDWSLLLAHCLGVDHCGHRYGPDHIEMSRKLRQMDELVKNITSVMQEDTLLVVMGDHGMTRSGDHGGDSQMETEAALFVYANKNFAPELDINSLGEKVDQVDLVPTLSLLLDLPIPFSNLGQVIEQLVDHNVLVKAVQLNAVQMIRYAQQYMANGGGLEPAIQDQLSKTIWQFENTNTDPSDTYNTLAANRAVIHSIKTLLRSSLNKFEVALALVGLLCALETLIFHLYLVAVISTVSIGQCMFRSAVLLLQMSVYFGDGRNGDVLVFLLLTTLLSAIYYLLLLFVHIISCQKNVLSSKFVCVLVTITFHSASYFSNSFVIYEQDVVRYMLQLLLSYVFVKYLVQNRRTKQPCNSSLLSRLLWRRQNWIASIALLFCMFSLRAGKWFELCREEHVDCVTDATYWGSLAQDDNQLRFGRLVLSFTMMCICNYLLQSDLFGLRSPTSSKSPTIYLTSAISWPMIMIIVIHWLCETLPHSSQADLILLASQRSAQLVYLITFLHTLFTICFSHDSKEALQTHKHMLFLVLSMILGEQMAISFTLLATTCLFAEVFLREDSVLQPLFLYLFSQHSFFALGHQATLTSIPWKAAFVGVPGNLLAVTSVTAVVLVGCCAAGLLHRRHLMFFKIFAPKFVFEAISFLQAMSIPKSVEKQKKGVHGFVRSLKTAFHKIWKEKSSKNSASECHIEGAAMTTDIQKKKKASSKERSKKAKKSNAFRCSLKSNIRRTRLNEAEARKRSCEDTFNSIEAKVESLSDKLIKKSVKKIVKAAQPQKPIWTTYPDLSRLFDFVHVEIRLHFGDRRLSNSSKQAVIGFLLCLLQHHVLWAVRRKQNDEIKLEDVSVSDFLHLLEAIYPSIHTGRVTAERVESLLHMANLYQVDIVTERCVEYLKKRIWYGRPEFVAEMLFWAQKYDLPHLTDHCLKHHFKSFDDVKKMKETEEFKLLMEKPSRRFLLSSLSKISFQPSERSKFWRAIASSKKSDISSRKSSMPAAESCKNLSPAEQLHQSKHEQDH
uniref:GPI ethanolamine phosphate transferase 3 n=1 Tax=Ditylenchus dipsaci TaxID=166011 RepID=A0A915DFZ1_9BILA